MKIAILADDLTGASDSVAPFCRVGFSAKVVISPSDSFASDIATSIDPHTEACAWDTETRGLSPEETKIIKTHTLKVASEAMKFRPEILFKKIDSSLKGHLRIEFEAMREAFPNRVPLICPAFPANGRIVKNGIASICGAPLERSVQDAFLSQQAPAELRSRIAQRSETFGKMISTPHESHPFSQEFEESFVRSSDLDPIFCDAETDIELRRLAKLVCAYPDRFLPFGSGGFASALATQMDARGGGDVPFFPLNPAFATGRVLIAVGSRNPVSRIQAESLLAYLQIRPSVLSKSCELIASSHRITVLVFPDADLEAASKELQTSIATLSKGVEFPFDALILTGGDTAFDVCETLGAREITIEGELEPGIVQGRIVIGESGLKIHVITKAGGFGDANALLRCVGIGKEGLAGGHR